ncbi:thioesterase domain-containing protein [Micromonospora sp. WMMA1363]|uniref:thioesterase II family protein n=1 Tax=Micromonospora sp. WMMA1363 TaxID=3053985 RepID=UPI00259CF5C0|nr:alpha/beta fold hydrolase [Micromonospora sp. WMMA1363]MDM4722821.1 thioesterase domain-containing protein [Micromonospora sp. WMMA1363]
MTGGAAALWLDPLPVVAPALRLLCLPPAGAGARFFQDWRRYAPGWLQLCPVRPPGRDGRIDEPAGGTLAGLAASVAAAVAELDATDPLPLAVFGHSMGGLLGYELTPLLRDAGVTVRHLFVSATPTPGPRWARAVLAGIVDPTAFLRRLGGTPAELWQHPELRDLVVATTTADLRTLARHTPGRHAVPCPVSVFQGWDDPLAGPSDLAWWRERTGSPPSERVFPGGHFYCLDDPAGIVAAVSVALSAPVTAPTGR